MFRSNWLETKLTAYVILSRVLLTLTLAFVLMANPVRLSAHEIRPSIADVQISDNSVELTIRLALESLVAGLDLAGLEDTNASPRAAQYDAARAMTPADLEQEFRQDWPQIRQGFMIRAGDTPVLPELSSVDIPEVGDLDMPRDTVLVLTVPLPADGSAVTIGWQAENGPLVIRQIGAGEGAYTGYLTDGQISDPLPRTGIAREDGLRAFVRYVVIGFEHIVPLGLDHILFVLGLFFFSLHMRPLLMQVTAFTLAHTVSLALATLKIVTVPAQIVEPLIAASIVYVAVENILWQKLSPWRTLVVFAFGLLHGLGFASVLGEIGLDPSRFLTSLIGFNIGVELGQLSVIVGAFLLVGLWFGRKPWYRQHISVPASVAIAMVGAWWFFERVFL